VTIRNREDGGEPSERDLDELESNIGQRRAAISEGIGALGEKLSPGHIKEEAKEKVLEMKDQAVEAATETAHAVEERAKEMGTTAGRFVRDNAIPLAMIGTGLGLLLQRSRGQARTRYRPESYGIYEEAGMERDVRARGSEQGRESPIRRRVHELTDTTRELGQRAEHRAGELQRDVRRTVQEAGHRAGELQRDVRRTVQEAGHRTEDWALGNPLASGVSALLAGIGVGLMVPPTRREREMMGGARDKFVQEARDAVQGVRRAATESARDVRGVISDATHH